MIKLVLVLALALVIQSCAQDSFVGANSEIQLTRGMMLSEYNYRVKWGFTGRSPEDTITFEVQAKTLGWVGLGFSPSGGMGGADIVVAGFDEKTGQGYLYDRHGKCNCFPEDDTHNDYALISAAQNDSHTTVVFSRRLSTCDDEDHMITNDTVRLIWAMGDNDAESANAFSQHRPDRRGARSTMLLDAGFGSPTSLPADTVQLDLTVANVTIPSDYHTLYWCKIVKLPMDWGKHHLIRTEPLIQSGNEAFLHHIVLYHCSNSMAAYVNQEEPCFSRDYVEFSKMNDCERRVLSTWAVGSEGVQYKDDIGFPLMEPGSSPYVLIEVHYDNGARQTPKQLDNSGIRLFLTPTLRPKELGSLMLGMGVSANEMIIPPKQSNVKLYSKCDMTCTQHLPEDGIYMTSALLHEHLLGVGVKLRHFRDGLELEPIFQDEHYDFNYQDERYLMQPRHILPNDTLIVECTFNSMGRTSPTYGGFGTPQEMCFVFSTYYPRNPKLFSCSSSPTPETYANAMKTTANEGWPKTISADKLSLQSYSGKYNWSQENADYFQETISKGNYYVYCEGTEPNEPERNLDELSGEIAKLEAQEEITANTSSQKLIMAAQEESFGKEFSAFLASTPLELPENPFRFVDSCSKAQNKDDTRTENDNEEPPAIVTAESAQTATPVSVTKSTESHKQTDYDSLGWRSCATPRAAINKKIQHSFLIAFNFICLLFLVYETV